MGLASAQLLDPTAGFFQSGMDSLMSVTLQRALSDSLGETLPASVVFDYPTVEALSDYLATLFRRWPRLPRTTAPTTTTTSATTNSSKSFRKGWAERDDRTARSSGDHHRGAAQDR